MRVKIEVAKLVLNRCLLSSSNLTFLKLMRVVFSES